MKKMIALIVCLMLCMAAVPVHAETAESLIEQAKALYAAEDYETDQAHIKEVLGEDFSEQ